MDKLKAARLKRWREVCTYFGLVDGQATLRAVFKNRQGNSVSQTYVSHMEQGLSHIPDKQIYFLVSHYTFTAADYFISGGSPVIDLPDLLRYLLAKHDLQISKLAELIHDPLYTQPFLSQLTRYHEEDVWQKVMDVFNELYEYNIKVERVYSIDDPVKEFTAKNLETKRFLECIQYLIDVGMFLSWKDAAGQIGTIPQIITNMKSPKKQQGVTFSMAAGLAKRVPRLNLRWLLLGEGSMMLETIEY